MLNERGFGLKEIMMVIFVMFAAILVTMFLYNRNFKDLFEGDRDIDSEPTITYKYAEAEKNIKNAAKEYFEDTFDSDDTEGVSMTVTSNTLIAKGYLEDFTANDNNCTGYVKINNEGSTTYSPYIKCGDYETNGY